MHIIETERLRLVPPSIDHAADVFAYGSRREFVEPLGRAPQASIDEAAVFLRGLIAANESGNRLYWCAEYEGRIVGTLGFIFHGLLFLKYRQAEFGYGFSPEVWGTGMANEAATAVLEWGADNRGIARYWFCTRESNPAQKAVEKLGFERDLYLPAFYPDGEGCIISRR